MLGPILHRHSPRLAGTIAGVLASGVIAGVLWILVVVVRDSPGIVIAAALAFSILAVLLLVSVARDAGRVVIAYEHGIGWGDRTFHVDDIAKVDVRDASIVIHTRGGDVLAIPANVDERDVLVAHVTALGTKAKSDQLKMKK